MHISPYYATGDLIDFKAIVGHELIHSWHYYIQASLGSKFAESYSEHIAYRYTVDMYLSAGQVNKAINVVKTATQLNYWNRAKLYMNSNTRIW